MRYRSTLWLANLFLCLLSSDAIAQSDLYVFAGIGSSDADVDAGTYGARFKRIRGDERSFTLGLGYDFSRHFSLEAAYRDYGTLTGDRDLCAVLVCTLEAYPQEPVDAAALAVSAIVSFAINDQLAAYGRLGLTQWEFDSGSSIYDDSSRGLHYGGGLRWSINGDWKVFAEYTRADIDIDTLGIGVRYAF